MKLKTFLKKNIPLVIILFFLIGLIILSNTISDYSFKKKVTASAEAGGSWLLEFQENLEDPGILWIMKQINDKYCQLPEFDNLLQYRFGEFKDSPIDKFFSKFINPDIIPSDIYEIDYQSLKIFWAFFSDMIIPALYCDVKEIPDDITTRILDVEEATGYHLSHKFLALMLIKENQCLPKKITKINETLSMAAEKMVFEEGQESFSDLYSERVAFLGYGGFQNLVKKEWLNEIIKNQATSGAWAAPGYWEGNDNPHTTALSVWALVQYSKTCPFILNK
jgi:hypothetical protein